MLVAEGARRRRRSTRSASRVWDLAAVQVVVEEAGGRSATAPGAPRIDGGSAISSNGLLHDELLAALRRRLTSALSGLAARTAAS